MKKEKVKYEKVVKKSKKEVQDVRDVKDVKDVKKEVQDVRDVKDVKDVVEINPIELVLNSLNDEKFVFNFFSEGLMIALKEKKLIVNEASEKRLSKYDSLPLNFPFDQKAGQRGFRGKRAVCLLTLCLNRDVNFLLNTELNRRKELKEKREGIRTLKSVRKTILAFKEAYFPSLSDATMKEAFPIDAFRNEEIVKRFTA